MDDDLDRDGFIMEFDCNDLDSLVNPNATEIVGNDIDENCDGEIGTSSTFEVNGVQISIFPNPVSDFLSISTTAKVDFQVNVLDISGKSIYKGNNTNRILVADWKAGHYFLKLSFSNSDQTRVEKIVVNHQ